MPGTFTPDRPIGTLLAAAFFAVWVLPSHGIAAQQNAARITEETIVLQTYPFSGPDPVPILASDTRLYPYHAFGGYAHAAVPREWRVVHLENDWIELWVLPEVGGKVWGARVKSTGHEFIYRNEVMKFRNISLRGPWTSGGIEFNFGVIGHTPATATPVDYLTRSNDDGSVSVFVGAMDLPSRTSWRVEVRLPADRAYFETNVLWHNPTTLEQPYYNWMTGAAFAQDDLVMSIPGNSYLEHPGAERAWPVDVEGRRLPVYDENRFGGNKSYHVVGELNDFFGGYYLDDDYGFGHWSRYEDMPGQKLWLWALSRQGGIWEDLLTDTDGQYIEFQAGRLLVQYQPGDDVNPISQVGFDPGATDRWSETWFPVERLGGLTDASRDGAMFVERRGDVVTVRAQAFGRIDDVLSVHSADQTFVSRPIQFGVLEPVAFDFPVSAAEDFTVELERLGLEYHSDPDALALSRPYYTDEEAMPSIPAVDRTVMSARELVRGRRLEEGRRLYESALEEAPWNREALLGLANLQYRRGLFEEGLVLVERALQLDAYDAEANYVAGNLYRALSATIDARESFGWAARSSAFRTSAYVQLAELALADDDFAEAARYGALATDYDRYNPSAYRVLAVAARLRGDEEGADAALRTLEGIDPLDHFVSAERHARAPDEDRARAFLSRLRSEYPEQEVLELAIGYARWGRTDDAIVVLELGRRVRPHPLLASWLAWLTGDFAALASGVDPAFVFPYRPETIPVLRAAVAQAGHWSWRYLLALNLWARDRAPEAAELLATLGSEVDFAPAYVTRASIGTLPEVRSLRLAEDREGDLRRAVDLSPGERMLRFPLIQYLQAEGRWEDALSASSEARRRFPGDFDLDLLHVTSLNATLRYERSIEILDSLAVLPSEHSGVSHPLFVEAHTMAGFDALAEASPREAARHFETAMTWPERLGLGRPYEPEERLQRYLLGVAHEASGSSGRAREAYEEVVRTTPSTVLAGQADIVRTDLLAIAALDALGRGDEVSRFGNGQEGALARIVATVRSAAQRGDDVSSALSDAAAEAMDVFADVEGRLLYRALRIER